MSAVNPVLPTGFEALAPFVEYWAVAPAATRAERRTMSTHAQRAAFYEVAKDLAAAALVYLDKKPLNRFDDSELRLMNLLCSFAHVAYAVEIQGDNEATHAQYRRCLKITRATADTGSPETT
jgi:hypothetical protein